MEILNKISTILNQKGFVNHIKENNVLVELCSNDVNKILDVYDKEELEGTDRKILEYGRKLESVIIGDLLNGETYPKNVVAVDGYDVDENEKKIYVRLTPIQIEQATKNNIKKLSKEKDGDGDMGKKQAEEDKGVQTLDSRETAIEEYENTENKFKDVITNHVDIDEAVGVVHDVLKDSGKLSKQKEASLNKLYHKVKTIKTAADVDDNTRTEVDTAVEDLVGHFREVPIEDAIGEMNRIIDVETKEQQPEPTKVEDKALSSLKKKIDTGEKKQAGGPKFDPVTDTITGTDEGPDPTFDSKESRVLKPRKDVTLSEEKPKQSISEKPTLSQEEYKKKKAIRVKDLVKKAKNLRLIAEAKEDEEFDKFMEMNDDELDNMEEVMDTVKPETAFIENGEIYPLEEIFGE